MVLDPACGPPRAGFLLLALSAEKQAFAHRRVVSDPEKLAAPSTGAFPSPRMRTPRRPRLAERQQPPSFLVP
jgi:hypothetical protein